MISAIVAVDENWGIGYDGKLLEKIVLPQEFFMNCAILIGVGIICLSVGIIIFQIIAKKRKNLKKNQLEN